MHITLRRKQSLCRKQPLRSSGGLTARRPARAWLGMGNEWREIPSWYPLCWGTLLQQGGELGDVLAAGMCSLTGDACGYLRASPPAPTQPRPAAIPAALSGFSHFSFPNSSQHPVFSSTTEQTFARSCLCRLPVCLPTFHDSSLYPHIMPFCICTTQHLLMMSFVPISLPICSISPTFSAALRIGSTFLSPEQLSISSRFCRVTVISHFPDNGF